MCGKDRNKVITAVAAVIENDGKVLLTLRSEEPKKGFWHHPGGGVEFGESLHQALQRELQEELGIETRVLSAQPVFVTQTLVPAEDRHIICLFFRAEIVGGELRPADGTEAFGFFDEAAAAKATLLDSCRDFLNRCYGWHL